MEPITREEILIAAAATGKTPSLTPITREEMFLAKAAGMDVNVPEPITRKEMFLSMITGSGHSGEVVDGLEIVPDFSAGDYEVVAPTGLLVRSAIIKKPKTLVPDNIAEGVEIAGIVGTHVGGGGSSADVRYVTFMNGDTVLYKKPVAVGDDCVDVLKKGLISTPTKESTVQYNYGYLGWGASDNGAVDGNILKNITEDKTVYAIFTATVRYYTITWLDEDGTELPGQKQWAYGTVPSYTPIKDGLEFAGWDRVPVAVTGDATYTAQWIAQTWFDEEITDSWEEIVAAVNDGTYKTKYKRGNYKTLEYKSYYNPTSTVMQIVDFDVDTLSDGSGKAAITWISKLCVNINKTSYETTNTEPWETCDYRNALHDSMLFDITNATLLSAIKTVTKNYRYCSSSGTKQMASNDKYWIPSVVEVSGSQVSPGVYYSMAFPDEMSRRKMKYNGVLSATWALRDSYEYKSSKTYQYQVSLNGRISNEVQSSAGDVLLGFCI